MLPTPPTISEGEQARRSETGKLTAGRTPEESPERLGKFGKYDPGFQLQAAVVRHSLAVRSEDLSFQTLQQLHLLKIKALRIDFFCIYRL